MSNLLANPKLQKSAKRLAQDFHIQWDLNAVNVLDNGCAFWLWRTWGESLPKAIEIKPDHLRLIEKWHQQKVPALAEPRFSWLDLSTKTLQLALEWVVQLRDFITLIGQLLLDACHIARHPGDIPWAEISITIYEAGVRALGITALVGFLIGIVLSYLSALQLQMFGAEIYIYRHIRIEHHP